MAKPPSAVVHPIANQFPAAKQPCFSEPATHGI
jgi:PleD family two-component response regulator